MAAGYQVSLHDPTALDAARDLLGNNVVCHSDPYECLTGAMAIALLTDWPSYRDLEWERIATLTSPGTLVLDSWRLNKGKDMTLFTYVPVGIGLQSK